MKGAIRQEFIEESSFGEGGRRGPGPAIADEREAARVRRWASAGFLIAALFGAACGPEGGTGVITAPVRSCVVRFTFRPDSATTFVGISGEWNGFVPERGEMSGPDRDGNYTREEILPAGAYAYKFAVGVPPNRQFFFDYSKPYTKYVNGIENSMIEVGDCRQPELRVEKLDKTPGGEVRLEVTYVDGADRAGVDFSLQPGASSGITALLDGQAIERMRFEPNKGRLTIDASGLPLGKHRITVSATDRAGRQARTLQVPFWIEQEPFDYRDGLFYFVFTDRFRNGDPGNDAPVTDTDPRANYAGGDFAGVTQAIEEGYFDALGVRTLWISPPNNNPDHWEFGADGRHYSGYHGYWPTAGRDTQPRFGTLDEMKAMVAAAHRRGMRVIIDSVLNHVHRENPLFIDHQFDGWFNGNGTCVCGASNCDWDSRRLDCWFTNYLPDLNYQNVDAVEAMVEDALFWAEEVDVDGFRVDAVKHFYEVIPRRLRGLLKERYEHTEPLYYLVGETFTGGDDGGRRLIKAYIGPQLLHAQFDFPIFWHILGTFAAGWQNMRGLDQAARATDNFFGTAPMSPFLGNHDVTRFISVAAGMIAGNDKEQAWTNPPPAPTDSVPYERLRLATTFLFTQPGVPLLYYGDEIGLPGTADPDNRRFMRFIDLAAEEQATLEHAQRVGSLRRDSPALRRGKRYTLWVDDDFYVYARVAGSDVAVVAINRSGSVRSENVPLRIEVPLPEGTMLQDRLGGSSVKVDAGRLSITLQPRRSAIYLP